MSSEEKLYAVTVSLGGYRRGFVVASSPEEAEEKAVNGEIQGSWDDYSDAFCEECEEVEEE